ncbi:MAG: hypothetical protein J1E37_06125 [Prevotella sp.]|nr:hypothetical protein [Prevotella sp.]
MYWVYYCRDYKFKEWKNTSAKCIKKLSDCGMQARGEDSAYLQGEIVRKVFTAAAMVICPTCKH